MTEIMGPLFKALVEAIGSSLMSLPGIGPQGVLADAVRTGVTDPGRGHRGRTTDSSATGSHPNAGSSDKPPSGPANSQPTTPLKTSS